jgi:Zn finger protein HypA/HybF involved in hydrogenase expression
MNRPKMKVECGECGKKFAVSLRASDPRCPRCKGVDIDVDYGREEVLSPDEAREHLGGGL